MDAIYISGNSFKVLDDRTAEFNASRRVKLDCGLDGIKYASVVSSSYSSPYTTVVIDESDLTASLTSALYGVTQTGETGSFPDHTHEGGVEGQGGVLDGASLGLTFLSLPDTPTTYSGTEGLFLRVDSTASGIEFTEAATSFLELTDTPVTYSGSEGLFLRVNATASGTEFAVVPTSGTDDHSHVAYVPWDFGSGTISGTGDIHCNDIYTSEGTVYIGNTRLTTDGGYIYLNDQLLSVDGIMYSGNGAPPGALGKSGDFYIDEDNEDVYKRTAESGYTYSTDLCTGGTATGGNSQWSDWTPSKAFDDSLATMWGTENSSFPHWLKYQFTSPVVVNRLRIYPRPDSFEQAAKTFQLQGSNTGAFLGEETVLLTVTNYTSWSATWHEWTINDNVQPFLYHKINITVGNGHPATAITEVEMLTLLGGDWQTIIAHEQSLLDLTDTPATYDDGKYLISTTSGVEWTTIETPTFSGTWVATDYEALELVAEYNLNNETLDVTFSGIQGNTDDEWEIRYNMSYAAASDSVWIQLNEDSTGGNYYYSYLFQINDQADGVKETSSNALQFGRPHTTRNSTGTASLRLKSGNTRSMMDIDTRTEVDAADATNTLTSSYWTNTADEVTSMRFFTLQNMTGYIRVYKRTNISLPIYDVGSTTFSGLTDTPATYDEGKYLISTTSGVEWTTVSGSGTSSYCMMSDVKSSATEGGTFTSGAWQTRDLNTINYDDDNTCSLLSNQIVLEPGIYTYRITAPAYRIDHHKARLYNATTSGVIMYGTPERSALADSVSNFSTIRGQITISGVESLEVQHACQTTRVDNGFGNGNSDIFPGDSPEIYTVAEFWKRGA